MIKMSKKQDCFHCGLPVPEQVHLSINYRDHEEAVCCAGCQAIAQSIIDAGLESYYEHRTAMAEKGVLPPAEVLEQLKLYDLPEVQAEFVVVLPEHVKEAVLMLEGISCAACTWLIEQRLLRLVGVVNVELNYSTQRVRVRWHDIQVQLSDILLCIRNTGYNALPYDAEKVEIYAQKQRKQMLIRLAVAGFATMQTMMFALPTYLYKDIEEPYLSLLHWGAFLMVLPVMFYAAVPFYKGAWRDFKNRRTGMDTPVAIAVLLAFVSGLYGLFSHAGEGMYFEGISMFVFFLQIGRFMEHTARRKAGDAAERLVKLIPAFCHQIKDFPQQDQIHEAAVVSLKVGDVILVKAGEVIPVDGVIVQGESEVNEAMLTGEHLPILREIKQLVHAGTVNVTSPLIIRVNQVGEQTRLAHIVQLLDRALSQKPKLAELADKYAAHFTLALLICALPTFLGWWWWKDAQTALWVTVSLLVITCPCALSLATPTALAASTGKLAQQGVLIARGHALETLSAVTDVVFDKTGTLTKGNLNVIKSQFFANAGVAIAIAKQLEAQSEHPIARAIASMSDYPISEKIILKQHINRVGHGISAKVLIDGMEQTWAIGRPEFVSEISGTMPINVSEFNQTGSLIALGNQSGFQALFILQDEIRTDMNTMCAFLQEKGLNVHILSGDRAGVVEALAKKLNIHDFCAEATPERKLTYIENLQKNQKNVLMVGDGINDAPVLAAAAVSVAVANSADVAREGADVVLINDDLNILPNILNQAQRTHQIIRQNLLWASAYNLIAVPLAILGYVTPWVAALGMSLSSLLVVSNALRLRR